jgi:O-antigen/teichoic acid export membrane protein
MNSSSQDQVAGSAVEATEDGDWYTVASFVSLAVTIAVALVFGPFWHYLLAGVAGAVILVSIVVGWIRLRRSDPGR